MNINSFSKILKISIISFLLTLKTCLFFGQSIIKLELRDSANQKISFANVRVLNYDDSLLYTFITNDNGVLSIDLNHHNKPLSFAVSHIGYEPFVIKQTFYRDTSIVIYLVRTVRMLSDIVITTQQPLILHKADRYIINVENSFLSTGYSANEILERSPGIWIDNENVIRIRGNRTVSVMVNGVVQRMSYQELQDFLKSIRSETISKIEVITNPSTQFDAEGSGGLINIITKISKSKGITGNFSNTHKQQGEKPFHNTLFSSFFKMNKATFNNSYSYTNDIKKYFAESDVKYPNQTNLKTHSNIDESSKRHQIINGVNYELSKRQTISFQNIANFNSITSDFRSSILNDFNGDLQYGLANSLRRRNFTRNSLTLNYKFNIDSLGSTFIIIGDYTYNHVKEIFDFNSSILNQQKDSIYRNFTPLKTNIGTIQADYKKVFKTFDLLLGGKFSYINRDNNLVYQKYINNSWNIDSSISNRFLYDEQIISFYFSINKQVAKTAISFGVRAENTNSRGYSANILRYNFNKYFNFFPSISFERAIDKIKGHSVNLSFSSKLIRPDFNTLNPYRIRIDNYTYQIGNSNLNPQYNFNLDLASTLFNNHVVGLYYNISRQTFANLLTTKPNNIIEYQVQNFDNSKELGLYISTSQKITKWWNSRTDFTLYYLRFQLQNYQNSRNSVFIKTVQTFKIPKVTDIDIFSEYRSPYVYSNAKVAHQYYIDLGFSKKYLNEKFKIRFLITDILNSLRDRTMTHFNGTDIDFYQKRPTRTFALTLSYNFNHGIQFKNKNIQQAGNDEKNRLD